MVQLFGNTFHFNNNFVNAKKKLVEQAQKALYSVYYKIRYIKIPKNFDTLVSPVLLYACEVIGFDKNDNIEKFIFSFSKNILRVRTTTPNHLVYDELGRFPLVIDIMCRMLTFWNKLILSNKLSSKIFRLLYTLNINGSQGFKWIELVKSTFDEIGLSFMYSDQQYVSADWLRVRQTDPT
jgi:hypothetical protein